jgi:hypothetical protein
LHGSLRFFSYLTLLMAFALACCPWRTLIPLSILLCA